MNYFTQNKPGWSGLFVSTFMTLCTLFGLSRGYVKFETVVWWLGVTFCSAVTLTIWSLWWYRKNELGKLHRENVPDFPMYVFYHGPEKSYQQLFYPRKDRDGKDIPEYILGSSMIHNGIVYSAMAPGRHHHVHRLITHLKRKGNDDLERMERNMGFITSHGRHLDRKEALLVAVNAKQLIDKTGAMDELFSEDVWDTDRAHRPMDYEVPSGYNRPVNKNALAEIYRLHGVSV